jgi:hypothetical protein
MAGKHAPCRANSRKIVMSKPFKDNLVDVKYNWQHVESSDYQNLCTTLPGLKKKHYQVHYIGNIKVYYGSG